MLKSMLRKLFGKCTWFRCEADRDQQQEQQFFRSKATISQSVTLSTLTSELNVESNYVGRGSNFQIRSDSFINSRTPVLFSTNRGLHLRVAKQISPGFTECSSSREQPSAFYDISFCDLERWSTNRAYTVSLEDTFTIARQSLEPVEEHPTSSTILNFPNRSSGSSLCYGSNNFMPTKHSVRFNNVYSRFKTGQ